MIGAVIPIAWRERGSYDQAFELGEGVSQYDVDVFGISLAGRTILEERSKDVALSRIAAPVPRLTVNPRDSILHDVI